MMKRFIFTTLLLLFSFSSRAQNPLSTLFSKEEGAIILYDATSGKTHVSDSEIVQTPYPPCSTFKIPNSLIALDLGVAKKKSHHMRWDAKKYPKQKWWSSSWAKDQTLESAFQNSVLWYYQELAKKIGFENYQTYLEKFDYGNVALTGDVDEFWIRGSLRITQREQIQFLQNFYQERWDLKKEAYAIVKEILVLEEAETSKLSGKTGTCKLDDDKQLGWLVGYYETPDNVIYYSLVLSGKTYNDIPKQKRIKIVKQALSLINKPS